MTAVEFLKSKLPSLFEHDNGFYENIFKQAMEMEKEQMRKTYDIGLVYDYGFDWLDMKVKTFEQYYNETYKSKNDENT